MLLSSLQLTNESQTYLSKLVLLQSSKLLSPSRKAKSSLGALQELAKRFSKFLMSPAVDKRVEAGVNTQGKVVNTISEPWFTNDGGYTKEIVPRYDPQRADAEERDSNNNGESVGAF